MRAQRRAGMLVVVGAMVAAVAAPTGAREPQGSGWSVDNGTPQNAYNSEAVAPTNPGVRWYSQLPEGVITSDGGICGTAVGCRAVIDGQGRLLIKTRDTNFDDSAEGTKYDLLALDPDDGSVSLWLDDMGGSLCVPGVAPDGHIWTFQAINGRTDHIGHHSRAQAWVVKVDPATGAVVGRYDGTGFHVDPDEAAVSHCNGSINFAADGTVLFIDTPPTGGEGGFDPWLRAIDPATVTPRWEHQFVRARLAQTTYDNAVRRVLPIVLTSPPDADAPDDAGYAYAFYNFDPRQEGAEDDRVSQIHKFDVATGDLVEVYTISTGDFWNTVPVMDPDGGIITVTGKFAEFGTGMPWVTRIVEGPDGLEQDWQLALEEERTDDSRLLQQFGERLSINGDLAVGYYVQHDIVAAMDWATGDLVWEYRGRQFEDTHDVPVDAVGNMYASMFGGAAAVEVFNRDGRRLNWLTGEELQAQAGGDANTQLRTLGPIAADGTLYGWAGTDDGGVWIAFEQDADVERVSGESRITTSVALSELVFPNPDEHAVEAVVLAFAFNYPDALSGGPLARAVNGPVLLTGGDELPVEVSEEIERLSPEKVYLLGGTGVLRPAIEDDLAAIGYDGDAVVRLAGSSRFDTAGVVAAELARVRPDHLADAGTAYVVEGQNADPLRGWPDAVSVSALAALEGRPILLVTRDSLPDETRAALRDLGITRIVVVGGRAAVSDAVAADLADYVPGGGVDAEVVRLSGANRFATSKAVIDQTFASPEYLRGLEVDPTTTPTGDVFVATGLGFADALGAGLAASYGSGLLVLVHGQDAGVVRDAAGWLSDYRDAIGRVVLVGGTGAITEPAAQTILDLVDEN